MIALIATLFVSVKTALFAVPVLVASERSVVSRPPPVNAPPTNGTATVMVPEPPVCDWVTPVLYPAVPATSVLFVPGVVEAIVAAARADVRPVFALRAHTVQPFFALVLTVAVRAAGLAVTDAVLSDPSASVLALSANEKVCGTVAVTTIWSSVMLAVANPAVSIVVGPESRVVIVPLFELVAVPFIVRAAVLVQLKQ